MTHNGSKAGGDGAPVVRFLDARQVEVRRDAFHRLVLKIGAGEVHEEVKITRGFPLTHPDRFFSFLDKNENEIGMLTDIDRLHPSSRRVIEEELERAYFFPVIRRIRSVQSLHGATTWEVETDRGDTTIYVKDRGEIRRMPGRRILFTDIHGLKYDIPDYAKLDDRSRTLMDNEI